MILMNDHLPKPRCSTSQREDYERACKLEGVSRNSNLRKLAVDFTEAIFRKHGTKSKRTTVAGNK